RGARRVVVEQPAEVVDADPARADVDAVPVGERVPAAEHLRREVHGEQKRERRNDEQPRHGGAVPQPRQPNLLARRRRHRQPNVYVCRARRTTVGGWPDGVRWRYDSRPNTAAVARATAASYEGASRAASAKKAPATCVASARPAAAASRSR